MSCLSIPAGHWVAARFSSGELGEVIAPTAAAESPVQSDCPLVVTPPPTVPVVPLVSPSPVSNPVP